MWRDDGCRVGMCQAADHLINSPAHVYALQFAVAPVCHKWTEVMGSSEGALASKTASHCLSPPADQLLALSAGL